MIITGRSVTNEFKKKHADARSSIDAWEAEAEDASWTQPSNIKQRYADASFLPGNKVVFNIKGNKYRLLVQVNYKNKIVLIEKAGTHNEYMKWG